MKRALPLSLACGDYDRTRGLLDGRVAIEGCDVTALALKPEETFFRAFRHAEFDVAELSFSTYLITTAAGTCPYVAIPAFVSRSFRHSAIYVRQDGPVKLPSDLRGRRVGVPEYQVTAAVWARAMLEDDYAVGPADMHWITGGVEESGRHEKAKLNLPADVRLDAAPDGSTLAQMLQNGEIDALICPRAPSCYGPAGGVIRLFEDPARAAADYWQKSGIFPIMHVVGVRRELAEAHPWLPGSVYKAFLEAKAIATQALSDTTALAVTLPWLVEEVDRTRALMGEDFWPYGLADNMPTLESFLDHHFRQGLSPKRLQPGEVFFGSTTERYKI